MLPWDPDRSCTENEHAYGDRDTVELKAEADKAVLENRIGDCDTLDPALLHSQTADKALQGLLVGLPSFAGRI